ncbi:hypothetical protein Leryth_008880 [Lithospermum erythrorhizon]|nr:hypothetical protein Leryth_008880 [Lithospermum erythrorhizon]
MAAQTTNDNDQQPTENPNSLVPFSPEDHTAKTSQKRYDGLIMVRNKAVKGKGAWYWHHLEPILITHQDSSIPKAVKLRCTLCNNVFSASNPSRTASEHLKRGTCLNFTRIGGEVKHDGSVDVAVSLGGQELVKKRSNASRIGVCGGEMSGNGASVALFNQHEVGTRGGVVDRHVAYSSHGVSLATPAIVGGCDMTGSSGGGGGGGRQKGVFGHNVMLSGGKEDLGALAMLEDSVKKLKSPKASPGPALSKAHIDSALHNLADWVYECCRSISISSLEHPRFKDFLNQVGLPGVSRHELVGSRLDAKYEEAKGESEAKIRDAMFFQIVSGGWKVTNCGYFGEENLVNMVVNLPNGTSVFRRALFTRGYVPSKYAEEVLWDTLTDVSRESVQQCVGVVADKFKAKALRNLENQHHWMVNLSCQYQAFNGLVKDFCKDLPLFKNVTDNCFRLVNFINNKSALRHNFLKYQLQEYGHAGLLRAPSQDYWRSDNGAIYIAVEDILSSARALQLLLLDESYKTLSMEEPLAREIEEMMRNPHFWSELEALHSLVKLVKEMTQEIETDKPRVGQCLPLWQELRVKVREWCSKYNIAEGTVEKVIERRFSKNYHPAWAAAFILDPLYLIRESSGKYIPPFKFLTQEQEKDVDKLITRLVAREEAPIVLMELMKWRTEGLDPVYAQAVQLKQRDPTTGKMKIVNPQSSRLVWETYLTEFKSLRKIAVRLIFLQATSCGFKCNWSMLKWMTAQSHSKADIDRAQKLIFIAAHSQLAARDFCYDEQKDVELLAFTNETFDGDNANWQDHTNMLGEWSKSQSINR